MFRLLRCMLKSLMSTAQTHRALAIENLALRQQLAVLITSVKRPRLSMTDRAFWVIVSRWWSSWRTALILVKPQTLVAWRRKGFRLLWAYRSTRRTGRPSAKAKVRIRARWSLCPRWVACTTTTHAGPHDDRVRGFEEAQAIYCRTIVGCDRLANTTT
jgi:hypothetical protein